MTESTQDLTRKPFNEEKSLYYEQNHCQKAFEAFITMRRQNVFCDVRLMASNGVEVPANRMLLAGFSSYFYKMFAHSEKNEGTVKIDGVDSSTLQALVDYVYTGKIEITEENVRTILPAAELLNFFVVEKTCYTFLKNLLNATNCLSITSFADLHGNIDLREAAETYILENFLEVVNTEEFFTLAASQLIRYIEKDELCSVMEEEIYDCVIKWVYRDLECRVTDLPSLMAHVRLPLTSEKHLAKVSEEPLICSSPKCLEYLDEAVSFHISESIDFASMQSVRTKPRYHLIKALLFIVSYDLTTDVKFFDLKMRKWCTASGMPSRRSHAGFAVLGNKVHVLGGYDGSSSLNTVEVCDILTGDWHTGVPMKIRRCHPSVAVVKDMIYVVGGRADVSSSSTKFPRFQFSRFREERMDFLSDSFPLGAFDAYCNPTAGGRWPLHSNLGQSPTTVLDTAEVFHSKTQQWEAIPPMRTCRYGAGLCILNDKLYAIGGANTGGPLNTVEVFDLKTQQWSAIIPMFVHRMRPHVGVLNDRLYVIGGAVKGKPSVECYDPKKNTWYITCTASITDVDGVTVMDNKLYASIASIEDLHLRTIVAYNPIIRDWEPFSVEPYA